jgi:hypothetical protein
MKIKPLRCPQCGSLRVTKETYKYGNRLKLSKIICVDCNKATKTNGEVEDYDANWWPKKARDPKRDTGDYLEDYLFRKD